MSRRRNDNDGTASPRRREAVAWASDQPEVSTLLEQAEVDECGLIPWGSNYTFLITLEHPEHGRSYAVYKPRRGEAPLGDFPEGTLYLRERAAYLVSQALGWSIVPPTVIREGPYGVGMVQLFIDADTNAHYLTFGAEIPDAARRIALFDCVINNADRKAGHLLRAVDGRIWAIDHGLTFHSAPKLRTVIWEFAGEKIPPALLRDLRGMLARLECRESPFEELRTLINPREYGAMSQRVERLLNSGVYPQPVSYRSVPWPAV